MFLVNDIEQIRRNLIQNENRLAQLHADIYKRREEARKIRLSIPTPEYLNSIKITDRTIEKLSNKKQRTLCSIYKLQENTRKDIETYTRETNNNSICLKSFIVIVLIILVFYLVRFFLNVSYTWE